MSDSSAKPQRSTNRVRTKTPEVSRWAFAAVAVLIALIAVWPVVAEPGLLNTRGGGDSPFLLQRLHQLVTAAAGGHFPVRWMPDANYGYGYPFYNFYAPLSIYIAGAFRFLGFSFVRSIHMAQLAGFLVAALGMYVLGRNWLGSRWAGLLTAAAYTVAPFHMVNVYVRGDSLAEFWAMALYPLVLLAADGVLDTQPRLRWRRIALFALAYAALILSHNISALIFSPFLLLYLILRWVWSRRSPAGNFPDQARDTGWRTAVWPLIGLALAVALAAWFFVPALAEQNLAQLGPVTEGYFHFSNHFRGLDLVQGNLIFDYSPDGGVAFHMGLVQAIMALLGGVILLVYTLQKRVEAVARPERLIFIALTALIATFMITPLSRPLWEHLPLLSYTQFPWRFLSVQALATALLTAGLAWPVGRQAIVPVAALLLLLGGMLGLQTDHLTLTDADITAERLAQYEWFTGNIGTTVSAEYLPPAVVPRLYSSDWLNSGERQRVVALNGSLTKAQLVKKEATTQTWQLTAGDTGATVLLPTLYWPRWAATSDGAPIPLSVQPGSGLMRLDLQPGDHVIELSLNNTPVRAAADWVSLSALVLVAGLLLLGDRSGKWWPWLVAVGTGILLLVVAAWALRQLDPKSLPQDDLTWDFAQMAYLHHDSGGVLFDNGARLYSYGYSQDEIVAGQTLTMTLSIDPVADGLATIDLATPALARPVPHGQAPPPVVASQEVPLDADTIVVTLQLPENIPTGLYVPRLTLGGSRPLMPSGQTRGDLFLRPLRVLAANVPTATDQDASAANSFAADVRADDLLINGNVVEGHFTWLVNQPPGQNYQLSWRLLDSTGAILAQMDTQPGYGFNPTLAWPAGQPVHDWLTMQLPQSLPGSNSYPLMMILYDPTDGRQLMVRRVGELALDNGLWSVVTTPPTFSPPDTMTPLSMVLSDNGQPQIQLHGYELDQAPGLLDLSFYWASPMDLSTDFRRFVHLIDSATNDIVRQMDGIPAGASYPTSQWRPLEIVADSVSFDTSSLPAGSYRVATGFYRPDGDNLRLDVAGADGPLPDGRIVLPEIITLP